MRTKSILLLVFSFLVLVNCSSDNDATPVILKNIIGNISLFNDEMIEINNSGMTVTAEGTFPLITSVTDVNGNYSLKNVPYGAYTLVYEKEGFGTYKAFNVEHEDVGEFTLIPNELRLGQISNSVILENTVTVNGNFIILTVTRSDTEDLLAKRMRIFYHNNDNVSNEIYTEFSPIIGTTGNPAALTFSISFFYGLGFKSGDTLWFKVYGENFYANSYEDPNLGITVFPNVNPTTADAISVVLP